MYVYASLLYGRNFVTAGYALELNVEDICIEANIMKNYERVSW